MDFFRGWHKPTVCTTAVVVIAIIIAYHLLFHARRTK